MGPTGGTSARPGRVSSATFDPFVLNAYPSEERFLKCLTGCPPQEIGDVRLQRRRALRDIVDEPSGTLSQRQRPTDDSSFASAIDS